MTDAPIPFNAQATEAEIRRLAALEPLPYEFARKAAAKDLGLRVTALDRFVEEARRQAVVCRFRPRS